MIRYITRATPRSCSICSSSSWAAQALARGPEDIVSLSFQRCTLGAGWCRQPDLCASRELTGAGNARGHLEPAVARSSLGCCWTAAMAMLVAVFSGEATLCSVSFLRFSFHPAPDYMEFRAADDSL